MTIHIDYQPIETTIDVDIQYFTSCSDCDWFGIPIIDDGAPDLCNKCLERQVITYYKGLSRFEGRTLRDRTYNAVMDEALYDFAYYFERMQGIPRQAWKLNDGQGA